MQHLLIEKFYSCQVNELFNDNDNLFRFIIDKYGEMYNNDSKDNSFDDDNVDNENVDNEPYFLIKTREKVLLVRYLSLELENEIKKMLKNNNSEKISFYWMGKNPPF